MPPGPSKIRFRRPLNNNSAQKQTKGIVEFCTFLTIWYIGKAEKDQYNMSVFRKNIEKNWREHK